MAWFDDLNLPGATIDGYFGFVQADGPDDDDYPDIVLANGTVTFMATTEAARVDGAWLGIEPVTAQIFEGRIVISEEDPRPVRLLATDANIGVADWAWRATFDVPGFKLDPLTFKAPRDTTVNLTADLIPIKSQPYQIIEGASIVDAEVSGDGTLRFELSDGSFTRWIDVPNGERGLPGEKGDPGEKGADGTSATLAMGSVTAGTTADAWMTGTPLARELHLTLPRGQKGDPGDKGEPGDPATPVSGTVSVTEGGSWGASLNLSGGILNLGLTVPPGGVAWHKGQLAAGTNLNELDTPEESGVYTLSSSGNYQNAPAIINGLPSVLMVNATGFAGEQEIAMYSSTYKLRRIMNNSASRPRGWGAWERIDVTRAEVDALTAQVGGAHKFHGTAPSGNLDDYRFASQSGSWGLSSSNTYTNLPPILGVFGGAILTVDTTGYGDTIHTVQYRFDGGRYTRAETSAGNFSAWRRIDYPDRQQHERELELVKGRAELAESATPILPMIETSGLWTTYGAGEALIERIARRNYPRRTITNPLDVKVLGHTVMGRRITAVIHGDPTLPALYIQAGVHGDETSSREAALKLSIDLSVGPIMDGYCVIVVATVNADMANIRRTNAINADLNRRWTAGQEQPENLAVKTLFADYDIRAVLDCHEGGTPDETQFAINETAGDITTSQLMFNTAAAAVDADPTAFPSSVWVDETRDGSAMEVFPVEFGVPYLLVEMPGGLGEATYWPSTETRMHSYRVVMDAIHDLFRTNLTTFTQ